MTEKASPLRPSQSALSFRGLLAVLGVILWFLFLLPPFAVWAQRFEYVQAIQYCVFAVVAPALLVTGAPWRWLGLASKDPHVVDDDGTLVSPTRTLIVDRFAIARAGRPAQGRAIVLTFIFAGLTIFWRTAPLGDALARHSWLAIIESGTLVSIGVAMWLELVESAPLTPRASRPFRIGMATIAMWSVWVLAYLIGLAHNSWYHAFHHVAGRGISLSADQQLSSGMMWLLTAGAFLPVVFWNLVHWLQSEEDPNDELYRLVRNENALGFFGRKD